MTARRREALAFGALGALAVLAWALVPTYPNYDAYYHLVWGRELLAGEDLTFEAFAAPTQHPLYVGLAGLLSLAGEPADRLLVLLAVLALVALTWGAYRLGTELFGPWPGAAGALFVGSSFAFVLYAVRAYVDVPFLALVVWAGALEAARPRRGWAPMALLAVAGLLRPEAWVLAGLYWLWCLPGSAAGRRMGLALLAAAAPVLWALTDLVVTGDPLYSVTATSALAEELGRVRGIENVPERFVTFLADVARPPVAAAGVIGLALAVRRFGWRRMAVPLGLLGAGAVTFVGTGVVGLSILPRYLTVPAVALCVLAGFAVMGFTLLADGPARRRWRAAAVGAAVLGLAFAVVKAPSFEALADELRFSGDSRDDLAALVADPAVRRGLACGDLTFPTYRLVPDARWILDAGPAAAGSRAVRPAGRGVDVYVTGTDKQVERFGEADGVPRRTNDLPPGTPDARHGPFAAYVDC